MSVFSKTVVAQLVTGSWIIGRLETEDGFVDEAVQKGLSEGGLVITTPLELIIQPTPSGKAQVVTPPYGYPVLQFDPHKDVPRFFPSHAFLQYPDEAPDQFADIYRQATSGIQLAAANTLPKR